jgi:hypothetical protein
LRKAAAQGERRIREPYRSPEIAAEIERLYFEISK